MVLNRARNWPTNDEALREAALRHNCWLRVLTNDVRPRPYSFGRRRLLGAAHGMGPAAMIRTGPLCFVPTTLGRMDYVASEIAT